MARPFRFNLPSYDADPDNSLTPEQRRAVNADRAFFSGVPGTGKTTVAIWRILRKKDDILFTYTRLLSASIGHLSKNNNRIWGAHQWYWHNCSSAMLNDHIASNSVLKTLMAHNIRLGKVVIDEGQD